MRRPYRAISSRLWFYIQKIAGRHPLSIGAPCTGNAFDGILNLSRDPVDFLKLRADHLNADRSPDPGGRACLVLALIGMVKEFATPGI